MFSARGLSVAFNDPGVGAFSLPLESQPGARRCLLPRSREAALRPPLEAGVSAQGEGRSRLQSPLPREGPANNPTRAVSPSADRVSGCASETKTPFYLIDAVSSKGSREERRPHLPGASKGGRQAGRQVPGGREGAQGNLGRKKAPLE